jgi:hypothetical protein
MRVSWVISAAISVSLFTSCSIQPGVSEDNIEDDIELPLIGEELEDEQTNLFHQDRNKSYSQIDRPWVLAKPLLEYNKSNSYLLKDE